MKMNVKAIIVLTILIFAGLLSFSELSIQAAVPRVTTLTATGISNNNATLQGYLDDDGGKVTEVYFKYWINETPYVFNTVNSTNVTGDYFHYDITGLYFDSWYCFYAEAKNDDGTVSGSTLYFNTTTISSTALCSVTTNSATGVEELNATLNGTLTSDGNDICYTGFQYGYDVSYGSTVNVSKDMLPSVIHGGCNPYVYKLAQSTLATIPPSSPTYGDVVRAVVEDAYYVYYGGVGASAKVIKVWKYNMTKPSTYSETTTFGGSIFGIAIDDTSLYVVGDGSDKYVRKYRKDTMAQTGLITTIAFNTYAVAVDNTHMYVTGPDGSIGVRKYLKSSFTYVSSRAYSEPIVTIAIDDNYYYLGSNRNSDNVVIGWKSNMTHKQYLTYGNNHVYAVSVDDTYLYVCGYNGMVSQYYKSNFSLKKSTKLGVGSNPLWSLTNDAQYLYAGSEYVVAPANRVYMFRKSDMSNVTYSANFGNLVYAVSLLKSHTFLTGSKFNYNIVTVPGRLYHYRATAVNSLGQRNGGDKSFLTKPDKPASITVTYVAPTSHMLVWTLDGTAYNNTVVRGKIGSYPSSPFDGVSIYNGTGTTATNSGLTYGDTWYYCAWCWAKWDDLSRYSDFNESTFSRLTTEPVVVTGVATGVLYSNATLQGTLTDDGGDTCIVRFEYGLTSMYGTNTSNDSKTSGQTFSKVISGLSSNTLYHYRAYATNGFNYSTGLDKMFTTKTTPPGSFDATTNSSTRIYFTWVKGESTCYTRIQRRTGYYPTGIADGTNVYNGTSNHFEDTGLTPGQMYYYSAWTFSLNWSDVVNDCDVTRPNAPTGCSYVLMGYSGTNVFVNVSWTKGTGANYTRVVYSSTGFPASPTDGTLMVNSTGTYYNFTMTSLDDYYLVAYSFTRWGTTSYRSWYSTNGTKFTTNGGLIIQCYDETTYVMLKFNLTISNQTGTQTYVAKNVSGTLVINSSILPHGADCTMYFTVSGYKSRVYTIDIYTNIFVSFKAYLPKDSNPGDPGGTYVLQPYSDTVLITSSYWTVNKVVPLSKTMDSIIAVEVYNKSISSGYGGWVNVPTAYYTINTNNSVTINHLFLASNTTLARVSYYFKNYGDVVTPLYYIHVVEIITATDFTYASDVSGCLVTVKRYINTTGQYEMVSSVVTDAGGIIGVYLLPGVFYKVFLNKTGYVDSVNDYIPNPANQYGQTDIKTLSIVRFTLVNETYDKTFEVYCFFNGTMYGNNSLLLEFVDTLCNVTDMRFTIYEDYNLTLTYVDFAYSTFCSLTRWFIVNSSRVHIVMLSLNQTDFGWINRSITVNPYVNLSDVAERTKWLEDRSTAIFGAFPPGYVNFFVIFGSCLLVLLIPGNKNIEFGIVFVGLVLGLLSTKVTMPWQLIALIPFFVFMGVLYAVIKHGKVKL